MDIRNWPLDQIMQLPDCAFGRRWPVTVGQQQLDPAVYYDISEAGLPEKCVIWELCFLPPTLVTFRSFVSLSLGDQLPATDAQFDVLEPLINYLGVTVAGRRVIEIGPEMSLACFHLRVPVVARGRRLVGRFEWLVRIDAVIGVICVVSSIPTEVPDWLISGPARSQ